MENIKIKIIDDWQQWALLDNVVFFFKKDDVVFVEIR